VSVKSIQLAKVQLNPVAFGQTDVPVPVSPQPILSLPNLSYEAMGKVWNYLSEQCSKMLTPAQCRALLGSRPLVITEGHQVKWYWWVIAGFVLGRITRRIL